MKNARSIIIAVLFTLMLPQLANAEKKVKPVKIKWIENILQSQNDTTYIINFWATWCIPCVAELPVFESIGSKYHNEKVKIILVSLDYVKTIQQVLEPFLMKKKIQSTVVLLNENDPNTWIDKVDAGWGGAIPATLILNKANAYRVFLEKELNFEQLDSLTIQSFKKNN